MAILLFLGSREAYTDQDSTLLQDLLNLTNSDDGAAEYFVGMHYNNGIDTEQNYEKAFEFFKVSALAGHPLGAYKLGCYYAGQGSSILKPDPENALAYKLIAADAGYSLAQYDVAGIYMTLNEPELAFRYMRLAANQGHSLSLLHLANFYFGGVGTSVDKQKAYAYLKIFITVSNLPQSPDIQAGLDLLAKDISADQVKKAEEYASNWSSRPSDITNLAGKGISSAVEYVASKK